MIQPKKSAVLMVGDNPHSDILGANQPGFDRCWYNPEQSDHACDINGKAIEPNRQIESYSQFFDQLSQ